MRVSKMGAPGGTVVITYGQGPAVSVFFQLPAQNLVYYRAMTPLDKEGEPIEASQRLTRRAYYAPGKGQLGWEI